MAHPEEPAAADAVAADNASKDEDEAVKKQLMASLGTEEVPKLEVLPHDQVMTVHEPALFGDLLRPSGPAHINGIACAHCPALHARLLLLA